MILSVTVVAPDTIVTLYNGLHEGSYGYTSPVLYVISSTVKLEQRQHVSAFVSRSLIEMFPVSGYSIS